MKIKIQMIGMVAAIIMGCFLVCTILFVFVDEGLNGVVVDWLEQHLTYGCEYETESGTLFVHEVSYWKVKRLVYICMIANGIFWAFVVWIVAYQHGRRVRKDTIAQVDDMMQHYLSDDELETATGPQDCSALAVQVLNYREQEKQHEQELRDNMRRHEQALHEETTRKNDLITYLAHDLKTPLTSVIGYLSLLDEVPEMPMEQRIKYVGITLDKAKRLEELINEFFDITRYNLSEMTLDAAPLDLSYMLMQMADEFYPLLAAHGNKLQTEIDENMQITGDAVKLARVYNNILKNAIAYSYENTPITLTAQKDETQVICTITNQGPTIPKEKLSRIFEKFFRLDESRNSNTGGAGLGLAIAKEIVTLHGGEITAGSSMERTSFCVKLPIN